MSSGSKSLEKAEKRAFSTLLLSDEETAQWSQRLIDAFGSDELGVLWAVVRFLGPGADSHKKLKWQPSFATLPKKGEKGEGGGVLGAFRASFLEYILDDVPVVMERQSFHAAMRDNPHKNDFKQYSKIVNFLEDQNCAWTVTWQRVRAFQDPRKALPKDPMAYIDWFFGGRKEYSLIEYCLVLDIHETQLRRSLSVSPTTSHKLLSALIGSGPVPRERDSPSSSSEAKTMDVTFEVGGGSASGSLTKRTASALVRAPTVRSTSSSSHSTLTLTRIQEKSRSVSSSGKRDS